MKYINRLLVLLFVSSMISCAHRGDKMAMGEVKYVAAFPQSAELSLIDDFNCDEIGLRSVRLIDSLLILSHDKYWTVLSTDAKRKYGTCLSVGGGPNEFVFTPKCAAAAYRTERNSLVAYVCDKNRGKLSRFNVSKFIATGKDSLEQVFNSERMNNTVWDVIAIGRDSVLMQVPDESFTYLHRHVLTQDSLWEPEMTKLTENTKVEPSSDLNILAKVTRCRPDGKRCVEAMLYLNQLNVYDTDGSSAMTICVGEDLDDVAFVESQWNVARKETYESVTAFDFGFGALYSGSVMDQSGYEARNSEMHFFTWDGVPVFKAVLPIRALSFDIDPKSGMLYAIDAEEDTLVAFDASGILDAYRASTGMQ